MSGMCKQEGTRKIFSATTYPHSSWRTIPSSLSRCVAVASGNRYVVLTISPKWVEAFAVPDQRADTIAKLFVEHVVCRHGVPEELLSDREANFLSDLIKSVCDIILGVKKINTSGYHPQTDGLVEKFNSTLINMIAKSCEVAQHDWDEQLPFRLYAYR